MTRSPSPLEKLKRLVRGIALWRFVRLLWRAPLAHREAVRLAQVMWRRTYRDAAPNWQPLDDTGGVISQIDNMHAGVMEDNEKLRTAALRFAATVVMLNRRAMLFPHESEKFEQACAELNKALLPNTKGSRAEERE